MIVLISIISTFIVGIDISYYPFIKEDYFFDIASSSMIALFCAFLFVNRRGIGFKVNYLDIIVLVHFSYICLRAFFSVNFYFWDPKFTSFILSIFLYFIFSTSFQFQRRQDKGKDLSIKILLIGFISTGVFQSILGVFQILRILPLTIGVNQLPYGTFYNSGIYSNYLALIFPFVLIGVFEFKKGLKIYSLVSCFLLLFVIACSEGRTSWLAIVLSSAIVVWFYTHLTLKKIMFSLKCFVKVLLFAFFLMISIVLLLRLYNFKENSANGRLLIWEISCKTVCNNPIFGHGFNSYQYVFNESKSNFFLTRKISEERMMLTGTTFTAFNEYIQILVEFGIIGLLLFFSLLFCAFSNVIKVENKTIKILCISFLSSFVVLSLFSYPLRITTNHLMFYVVIGIISSRIQKHFFVHRSFLLGVVILSILINLNSMKIFYASLNWKKGLDLLRTNNLHNDFYYFDSANKILSWNSNFLYNYGCNLLLFEETDSAIIMLEQARILRNDDLVYMRLAEAYENIGDYAKALVFYNKASCMIPYLLVPKFRQFLIYKNQKDYNKAMEIALSIVNAKIKVYNKESIHIKNDALLFVSTRKEIDKK